MALVLVSLALVVSRAETAAAKDAATKPARPGGRRALNEWGKLSEAQLRKIEEQWEDNDPDVPENSDDEDYTYARFDVPLAIRFVAAFFATVPF